MLTDAQITALTLSIGAHLSLIAQLDQEQTGLRRTLLDAAATLQGMLDDDRKAKAES